MKLNVNRQSAQHPTQVLLPAPELRRCGWYVLAAVAFVPLISLAIRGLEGLTFVDFCMGTLFASLPGIYFGAFLLWRIEIDDLGFTRRIGPLHDRWLWSDFANGHVTKAAGQTLTHQCKRWPLAKLRYGLVAEQDIVRFVKCVNEHFVLPAQPDVESLSLRIGFRTEIEMNLEGISIQRRKSEKRHYEWSDVRLVLISREDALRDDFLWLICRLPDDEFKLAMVKRENPGWQGATACEINAILSKHIAADRIDVAIRGEPEYSEAHREVRQQRASNELRSIKSMLGIFGSLMLVMFLLIGATESWLKALVLVGSQMGLLAVVLVAFYRKTRRELLQNAPDVNPRTEHVSDRVPNA